MIVPAIACRGLTGSKVLKAVCILYPLLLIVSVNVSVVSGLHRPHHLNPPESSPGSIPSPPRRSHTESQDPTHHARPGEEKEALVPQVFVQAEPLFLGEIRGGKVHGDLSQEITEETWETLTNCDFYVTHEGTCNPSTPFSPCRYCKTSAVRWLGTPSCPPPESLVPQARGQYQWVLKPVSFKGKFSKQYLCLLEAAAPGADVGAVHHQQPQFPPHISAAKTHRPLVPWMLGVLVTAVAVPY